MPDRHTADGDRRVTDPHLRPSPYPSSRSSSRSSARASSRSSARTHRTPPPARRTPLLLRLTLTVAVVVAVAASLVRAQVGNRNGEATLQLAQRLGASPAATGPSGRTGPLPDTTGRPGCHVTYAVSSRTPAGYTAVLTLANTGSTPLEGWTLRWTYRRPQPLTDGWNATVTTDGTTATATPTDAGLNRRIPPGGSTTIGFVVLTRRSQTPTGFQLDGVSCR